MPAHTPMPALGPTGLARLLELMRREAPGAQAQRSPPPTSPAAPGLTHHQIIVLAAPFVRMGLAVDLAASDRPGRRLNFRPVPGQTSGAAAEQGQAAGAIELTLELHSPSPGYFRLTRTARASDGLQATLWAEGTEPGELLARVQAVPPQQHFPTGGPFGMACSGRLATAEQSARQQGDARGFQLTQVTAHTDELALNLRWSSPASSRRASAELELQPHRDRSATPVVLPADLLAVLGWDWSMLYADNNGWQCRVRLRGSAARRGDDALRKLQRAAAHLARTLGEAPTRFHERLRAAR